MVNWNPNSPDGRVRIKSELRMLENSEIIMFHVKDNVNAIVMKIADRQE